jgi:hypothetical protein
MLSVYKNVQLLLELLSQNHYGNNVLGGQFYKNGANHTKILKGT